MAVVSCLMDNIAAKLYAMIEKIVKRRNPRIPTPSFDIICIKFNGSRAQKFDTCRWLERIVDFCVLSFQLFTFECMLNELVRALHTRTCVFWKETYLSTVTQTIRWLTLIAQLVIFKSKYMYMHASDDKKKAIILSIDCCKLYK